MPKRDDIRKILVIGSGPIVIGQACEFDYAGTQALKVLKKEGYQVVLVNSNPATIMTDPDLAYRTYIEPLTKEFLTQVIEKERPDAVLPILGGQTALNLTLELIQAGVLDKFSVEVLGASAKAIHLAEDRQAFKQCMAEIGASVPRSMVVNSLEQGISAQQELGFPLILRPSFTLGGSGGGIVYRQEDFDAALTWALKQSPTHECLIEESVLGWKEFELEVMRDSADCCVIVCSIENIDPMGVHTGDSITVAPQMTLSDKEYQAMRDEAFRVIRRIGVACGGANVQFAVDPRSGRRIVVEMNPRVSRSSALASKATGFPIAKIAALLAIGYTLDEIPNDMTGYTKAAFEPSLDYVVVKIPRFAFEKFKGVEDRLGTQMKSVGEVMAIGRTLIEAMQKAMRGLEVDADGVKSLGLQTNDADTIESLSRRPHSKRLFVIGDALRAGFSEERISECSGIDLFFIRKFAQIIQTEQTLVQTVKQIGAMIAVAHRRLPLKTSECAVFLEEERLFALKAMGFSDKRIAFLLNQALSERRESVQESTIRALRHEYQMSPGFRLIDTCAAEFAAQTPYFYSAYEKSNESVPSKRKKVIILGSGPNRIGQGIEFDYCCVHAAFALKESGIESIMVNCNPETVSTDYDTSDRLYFEPLTLEDVIEICKHEQPMGVIVQYGGQTPLKLAQGLHDAGIPILGTSTDAIDCAEDRERFRLFLKSHLLRQPASGTATSEEEALLVAKELGYPLIMRPSYVLGGRAMEVVYSDRDLKQYIQEAVVVSQERPVLVERFLTHATEVDVDAVCDGTRVWIGGMLEHIEEAGVHSGDAAMAIPPFSLSAKLKEEIAAATTQLALGLGVKGLINVQFAIQDEVLYVLEVNPRASRTVPFLSKVHGVPLAKLGTLAMLGQPLESMDHFDPHVDLSALPMTAVKASVFPFAKFPGSDTILGPEMRSTGEVMGIDPQFHLAVFKALLASGVRLPQSGLCFLSVRDADKQALVPMAQELIHLGFSLIATQGTRQVLLDAGLTSVLHVNKVGQGSVDVVKLIENKSIHLVINTTVGKQSILDSFTIRECALKNAVAYFTILSTAREAIRALAAYMSQPMDVKSIQQYHQGLFSHE